MDFSITKTPGARRLLGASIAALSFSAGAALADSALTEVSFPGALMQKACVTSGAVAQMEQTGGYELSHVTDRVAAMNDKIEHQKEGLDDVGLAICDQMYRTGYAQAENGLWNAASVTASLNVIEMDREDFGHLVAMARWSSPGDIASNELEARARPPVDADPEGLVIKAYEVEALAGVIEFASFVNIDAPGKHMSIAQSQRIMSAFETEDFGPGDNFARYGISYMRGVSDVITVQGGIAKIDPAILKHEDVEDRAGMVSDPMEIKEGPASDLDGAASGFNDI